jgi:hypothetical protein
MQIDVDDDGELDIVTTYFAAIGDSAGWRLRIEPANGPIDDIAIEGVGAGFARILGGVQVDLDVEVDDSWDRELLVQVGANASGVNLGVYGQNETGCLFRFSDGDAQDLVLPIHASIGTMSGMTCDNIDGTGFLAQLEAEHGDGSEYHATYTMLDRVGEQLIAGVVHHYDIDADTQQGWLSQFGDLNCGGIEL